MRKFLIGCGAVLGVLMLIGIVGTWVLVGQLKKELPDLKHMEEQQEELLERFGAIDEYLPPLDGRIPPERMEIYLAVRQALPKDDTEFLRAINDVAEQEERIEEAEGFDKVKEMYRIAKQGMGVARVAVEYLAQRDSVLLAEGMGTGEYLHLTVVGPILGLRHEPERCAPDLGERLSPQDAESLDQAHRALLKIFEDQLARARRQLRGMEARSEDEEAYLAALNEEFEHGRIGEEAEPFVDGLPAVTEQSLSPYWDRLRASLPDCRETWSLELLVATDENNRGLQVNFERDDD